MPKNFEYWKKQHDSEELKEFNTDRLGTLWLKVKSIVRREYINQFCQVNDIELENTRLNAQFKELYHILSENVDESHELLNNFISNQNTSELDELDTDSLVQELYKVETFKWGADNQNDLGKYLVKKYIKDNTSYDYLIEQMETGVLGTVQDYLVCSWYNHWSSILIEHLFKSHEVVLPTVGQIKSVDFFMNEIPFDLKVTYLPTNFIEFERKQADLRPELTTLKQAARAADIKFNNDDSNLYYSLTERLKDKGGQAAQAVAEIRQFRLDLIDRVKADPLLLARNLYENQSDFRFGAENRIFLILIDRTDFDQSWKLKRNVDLLEPAIHSYLDTFEQKSTNDLKLEFYKQGDSARFPKKYEVLTDVIIVERDN
ncbi:hypothetical protein [Cecembia lonarensis]|uniref:Uncharacterized protein n=1 Tax=Cecembia lonarensis (strain CCUG 58316 / KCTC 22772 / LW9) TaxID=1225176 RepID=K1KVY7_CECL9|nr:hypothetical protein [Cecembia lonarensis]EKB48275.1 hypothetical protein B879_03133 [Cecembia lonarensis LW9]